MIDGQQQRRALTAAEQAIQALGAGDAPRARQAADRAGELDQIDVFGDLPAAVGRAADDLDRAAAVSVGSWDAVAAAVGPGPLAEEVAILRRR